MKRIGSIAVNFMLITSCLFGRILSSDSFERTLLAGASTVTQSIINHDAAQERHLQSLTPLREANEEGLGLRRGLRIALPLVSQG